MTTRNDGPSPRRQFLKTAGVLAVGTAAVGSAACDVKEPSQVDESSATRTLGFDRTLLDALASTVLPASLGAAGVRAATDRFVAWADGYDPVAEEMHGYGYADVRYLPADPAPAWRAQLDALDALIEQWTGRLTVQQIISKVQAIEVPAGPVATVAMLHRQALAADPAGGGVPPALR